MVFTVADLLSLSSDEIFTALTADRVKPDATVVGRRRVSTSGDAPCHVDGPSVVLISAINNPLA